MPIKKITKKASPVIKKAPVKVAPKIKIEQLEAAVGINGLEYSSDALFYKVNEIIDAINNK